MLLLLAALSNKLMAVLEIVVILAAAAISGYILSRILLNSRLSYLRGEIELKQIDLAECRSIVSEKVFVEKPVSAKIVKMVYPTENAIAHTPDDLKVLEGVGPKIEEILNKHGISTYSTLSDLTPVRIATILRSAGPRYQIHDPSSWPKQASLAKEGKWDELEELKIKLISGRPV